MDEGTIKEFWNTHPCGHQLVGGLKGSYEDFFRRYDALRFSGESHIIGCLDQIDFENKRVLEIGLGQGADSQQIIRRGAKWSGIDLTPEAVDRVKIRLALRELPYEQLEQGSVLDLPFEDNSFDLVFSHGVLHHVPNVREAQREIARVLRPQGQLIIMVYARISLNYLVSIWAMRRLGLAFLYFTGIRPGGIYNDHIDNAANDGLFNYLKIENFIHRSTDGPFNPYSKVYSLESVKADFPLFRVVDSHKEHMHAPPLPVSWLPGARYLGWHMWVHMARAD